LRQLLREHITEPFDVIQIEEFEDEFDSQGQAIPQRDIYRRRYEGRLARLREVAPDRTDIHDRHIAILRALEATAPSERLYYWTAQSQTREYYGVATVRSIVSCLWHQRPSHADKRDAMRCSEPGGSVAVAIVASRAPGRWVVRRLNSRLQ